jgi:hypothetical protein
LDINKANCASKKNAVPATVLLFRFKKWGEKINIQPFQGWFVVLRIFVSTGFTGGYFYSTPSGLVIICLYLSTDFIGSYQYSTPSGLGCCVAYLCFHRFYRWLFLFNPFGVGLDGCHLFPPISSMAIFVQPLWS